MPPGEVPKERKDEKKVDGKKKTQAEIEQEMATLQYTNPMLLEVSRYPIICSSITSVTVYFLQAKRLFVYSN